MPLAVEIFLGYTIVFIGVVALTAPDGFSYKHAFDDLKDSKPFVWGLLAGGAFSVAVATALGWWREILIDRQSVRGWLRWMPVIVFVLILATTDYANFARLDGQVLLWTAAAGVLVGFAEELTFRGLVLIDLRKTPVPESRAWLLSSLLFGLLHLPNAFIGAPAGGAVVQVALAFFAGTSLYVVRRASGSIIMAMVAHGLWDFTVFSAGDKFAGSTLRIAGAILLFIAFMLSRRLAFDTGTDTAARPVPA